MQLVSSPLPCPRDSKPMCHLLLIITLSPKILPTTLRSQSDISGLHFNGPLANFRSLTDQNGLKRSGVRFNRSNRATLHGPNERIGVLFGRLVWSL